MMIYKIFRAHEWAAFEQAGQTAGAPVDLADGFVHFSTEKQLAETVSKHFNNEAGLKILALDPAALGDALKWEPSRGGDLFPHLYRPLHINDIIWSKPLPLGPEGHIFPAGVL